MKTIDNDIKAGDFKKVYLLYGQERYLIKQYRDKLIKAMVSEGDSMNFSSFEGDGINQKEIIDLAETLPFFADKRVILIEDAGIFSKAGDELGEYLKDSPEARTLYLLRRALISAQSFIRRQPSAVILWSSRNRRMRHLPDG